MLSTGSTEVYSKHLLDTLKNSVITCCIMEKKQPTGRKRDCSQFSAAQNVSFVLPFFLMWQEEGKQLSLLKL